MRAALLFILAGVALAAYDIDYDLLRPFTKKIDKNGKYLRFPGINLICMAKDRATSAAWRRIYEFVRDDETFRKYYSALPPESYHMTVHPMYTLGDSRGNPSYFNSHLVRPEANKAFRDTQSELDVDPFTPTPLVSDVYARGIIALKLRLNMADNIRAKALRKRIVDEAQLPVSTNYVSHVTLAYRFREPETEEERAALQESVNELRELVSEVFRGAPLQFENAGFTFFDNMLKFVPTNPFKWDAGNPYPLDGDVVTYQERRNKEEL